MGSPPPAGTRVKVYCVALAYGVPDRAAVLGPRGSLCVSRTPAGGILVAGGGRDVGAGLGLVAGEDGGLQIAEEGGIRGVQSADHSTGDSSGIPGLARNVTQHDGVLLDRDRGIRQALPEQLGTAL